MSLHTSSVHKNLDTEIKILGLYALDLLLILMLAMMMNVLFGNTAIAEILVFGLPSVFAIFLYFLKKGKPKNFLIDYIKFVIRPGHYSANTELQILRGKPYEKINTN